MEYSISGDPKGQDDFLAIADEGRCRILKGVARLYYQRGLPFSIIAHTAQKKGCVISWLHMADELLKHGWSEKTILSRFREEFRDGRGDIDFDGITIDDIEAFLAADYDRQRTILFAYLFPGTGDVEIFLPKRIAAHK